MDYIGKLIEEIRENEDFKETYFTSSFINNVSEVFERYGFGVTKIFLVDKEKKFETRNQAKALLKIISKFENYPQMKQDRRIGRLIIKNLDTLKRR
jgi:hypothetical protein